MCSSGFILKKRKFIFKQTFSRALPSLYLLRWFLRRKTYRKFCFLISLYFHYQCLLRKVQKKIDHRAYLRNIRGKTHPIRDRTGTNHARHFIGPQLILQWLESRVFKVTLEKNLMGRQSHAFEKIWYMIWGKITYF